jgi:acyl-CoA synthetase (AMP-forming)/AMP-acid ligase II
MPSPVGHSTRFNYGLRFAIYHGHTLTLQDPWDPALAVDLLRRFGCSYTLAATTFLKELTEQLEETGTRLDTMTRFGCGGAPVPADLVRRAARVGVRVLRLYGSTEGLVVTWNRPDSPPDELTGSDGRVMTDVEVTTVDDEGAACGPGVPGEILVRGPNTCLGYFADPVRTEATFLEGGWVRSGDVGVLDEHGYLAIVGRKKEIIIRGGLNIAPREIEDVLARFPELSAAAVIGLPDERLGERMCACVVLRPGRLLDLATVSDRLRETGMATYKLPERLEVLDHLPMTASGKVQKHELVRAITDRY